MARRVSRLKWAIALTSRPSCIPVARARRGAKAAGLRYERALARALPGAEHGRWFEFDDVDGRGYAQVDLLREFDEFVLVLEAKYTWTLEGHHQIEWLYRPVVEKALAKPVRGLVICKVLASGMNEAGARVFGSIDEAMSANVPRAVVHWLGAGPIIRAIAKAPTYTILPPGAHTP